MGEREAGDVDTSRAGTRWRRIDGTGITFTEVARLVGGLGLPAEVKLEPSWREGGSWRSPMAELCALVVGLAVRVTGPAWLLGR